MSKNTDKKTRLSDRCSGAKSRSVRRGFFDEALLSFEDDKTDNFAYKDERLKTESCKSTEDSVIAENGTKKCSIPEGSAKPENAAAPENGETVKDGEAAKEETAARKDRKNIIIIFLISTLLLCALLVFKLAFDKGVFGEKDMSSGGDKENSEYKPILYPPDFETDIFTLEEYLALDRRIIYSPDGAQRYVLPNGDFSSEGEVGLIVIGEYLNSAISGDHERLNGVFTDEYFKENERYGRIPPQKIFETKIMKYRGSVNGVSVQDGTRAYFIVSYKIFLNDGLFRDDIDEDTEIAQFFEICIYPDGTGKINKIVNLPGYQI